MASAHVESLDPLKLPGARSAAPRRWRLMHPLIIRITHWTNAVAMFIMVGSGWKIYNDEVIFGWLHFPDWITIGGEAQGALQWHFAAMWVLMFNGLIYLAYGLASGRLRRLWLPIRPLQVLREVWAALRFRLEHHDLTHYNAVQKVLYVGIVLVIITQVVSGLYIWKPVQFSELGSLFYSFQVARLVHFIGMSLIVGFVLVHVALALLVPQTLLAMLTGGPRVPAEGGAATAFAPSDPKS